MWYLHSWQNRRRRWNTPVDPWKHGADHIIHYFNQTASISNSDFIIDLMLWMLHMDLIHIKNYTNAGLKKWCDLKSIKQTHLLSIFICIFITFKTDELRGSVWKKRINVKC